MAGACRAEKGPDAVAQAGAAAGEALSLIDRGFMELEPNTAYIVEEDCSGCKSCIPLCSYNAISFGERKNKAEIQRRYARDAAPCCVLPVRINSTASFRRRGDLWGD